MGIAGRGGIMRPDTVEGSKKKILVITNDSTVFLKDAFIPAFDMFGGRCTEVKNLFTRISAITDASMGFISGKFGFVPSNYVVMKYDFVPSCKEDYEKLQEEKDFVGQIAFLAKPFDKVVLCVPKDMFAMLIPSFPDGKLIAVTNEMYKDVCREHNWSFYPRKGARVGNENADAIIKEIENLIR